MIEISIPSESSIDALVWCKKKIGDTVVGYFSYWPAEYFGPHNFWSPVDILLMDFAEALDRDYDGDMILVLRFEIKNEAMHCRLRFG